MFLFGLNFFFNLYIFHCSIKYFLQVTDAAPFIVAGLRYTGEQTKGGCLVPKRAVSVMRGEVARLLQLADHTIVPITWQVSGGPIRAADAVT